MVNLEIYILAVWILSLWRSEPVSFTSKLGREPGDRWILGDRLGYGAQVEKSIVKNQQKNLGQNKKEQ